MLGLDVIETSLMTLAQQMRIEFVDIRACFGTNVTFPWIRFAVAALVQEVERLIGKFNATISAQQISLFRIRAKYNCIVIS